MAVARIARKRAGFDTATRMAIEADFDEGREPGTREHEPRKVDPIDELKRIVREQGAEHTPRWPKAPTNSTRRTVEPQISPTGASRFSPPDRRPPSRPPRTYRHLPWCARNCGCPGNDKRLSSC